uniref:Uncharacterized protein n=1 Tax=Paulinella chromatophora TaxID=39717 RepID=B1X5T3_PAUCH|nr:hypothetical protein PCC_0893 [Paulinella chromatophora]ACB43302.1 hypothetical protein PCC_0893 [Paulinella chromatophora]
MINAINSSINPVRTLPKSDWELDFYSRSPIDTNDKKCWELIICSTPSISITGPSAYFRWEMPCPSESVNSLWLKEALGQAIDSALEQGFSSPRRLRSWRSSMRIMIQRAVESFGIEFVPSRRCYTLMEWIKDREIQIYSSQKNMSTNIGVIPSTRTQFRAIPLPTAAQGDSWSWASLPMNILQEASNWEISFSGLLPLPIFNEKQKEIMIPGVRLLSLSRSLAIAGWIQGLEPVRLEICETQLVLEAGLEDRWLLTDLPIEEALVANEAFTKARMNAFGVQFLAVQSDPNQRGFDGLWMLRNTEGI